MFYLLLPFAFQGIVMSFDELYFHRKRGLPLWERIGHPIDTLSVFICYLFLTLKNPSELNMKVYVALCAFSCLLVTKDEFVHTKKCEARENWLHAVLFILHPITFLSAGIIWEKVLFPLLFKIQLFLLLIVMFYQVLYWRHFGKSKQ